MESGKSMKQVSTPAWLLTLIGAVCATGCSESSTAPTGTVGEVGHGVFTYVCVGDADAVCNETAAVDDSRVRPDLGVDGQLPVAMAVGGRFNLSFYGGSLLSSEGTHLPTEIVPVIPDMVRSVGGFSFRQPGTVAFLVRNPQGIVVDFIHLYGSAVDSLDLWWAGHRVTHIDLEHPSAETTAAVVPMDVDGIALAGSLGYSWSSSDPAVMRVGAVGTLGVPEPATVVGGDEVRVVAVGEGDATLQLEVDDFVLTTTVSVGPEVTP